MNPKLAGIYKTFLVTQLVLESIKESGGGPSSFIYLALQGVGINLDEYQQLLAMLKKEKAIVVRSHYITSGAKLDEVLERMTSMCKMIRERGEL